MSAPPAARWRQPALEAPLESCEEVRCSRAGELLSDDGRLGFLASMPLAALAWWRVPVGGRRRR